MLPKDPVMLLSFTNTQLRDNYSSLADFCNAYDISIDELKSKLSMINYQYIESENQFK